MLLLTEAAREPDPLRLPLRMAKALCAGMGAQGAAVTLVPHTVGAQLLCASDAVALRLAELQFEVGHGPGIACAVSGEPVVVEECQHFHLLWPLFSSAVGEQLPQVQGLWAFPVLGGGEVVATVLLYRTRPWPAHRGALQQGMFAAQVVAGLLKHFQDTLLDDEAGPLWEPREVIDAHWLSAHRAAGALAEHLGVTAPEALLLMRARSLRTGIPLPQLAAGIARGPASWTSD
ncbi:GAF domain-containing protein [Streptomyces sp. NPDC004111]|uniref:GAF domain-containing protein n=1 Tax=Streptomyces sp. NPDC004111 TaxID=3364690 RepID=UPI0036C871A8